MGYLVLSLYRSRHATTAVKEVASLAKKYLFVVLPLGQTNICSNAALSVKLSLCCCLILYWMSSIFFALVCKRRCVRKSCIVCSVISVKKNQLKFITRVTKSFWAVIRGDEQNFQCKCKWILLEFERNNDYWRIAKLTLEIALFSV